MHFPRAIDVSLDLFFMGAALMLTGMLCWWILGVVKTRLHGLGISLVGVILSMSLVWYMAVYPSVIEPARSTFLIDPLNSHQVPLAHVEHQLYPYNEHNASGQSQLFISVNEQAIHLEEGPAMELEELHEALVPLLKRKKRAQALLRQRRSIRPILALERCLPTARTYEVMQSLAHHEMTHAQTLVYATDTLALQWLPMPASPAPVDEGIVFRLSAQGVAMQVDGEELIWQERCDPNNVECRRVNLIGEERCAPTWDRQALAAQVEEEIKGRFGDATSQTYRILVSPNLPTHHVISLVDALHGVCMEPDPDDWKQSCRQLLDGGTLQLAP